MNVSIHSRISTVFSLCLAAVLAWPAVVCFAGIYTKPLSTFPDRGGYLEFNGTNKKFKGVHLGEDYKAAVGTEVFAVLDGDVVISDEAGGYGGNDPKGGVIVIRHKNCDGDYFYALYGHINRLRNAGDRVGQGELIGTIRSYFNIPHLHFGINAVEPSAAGYGNKSDWRDPFNYLEMFCKDAVGNRPTQPEITAFYNKATLQIFEPDIHAKGYEEYDMTITWSSILGADGYVVYMGTGLDMPDHDRVNYEIVQDLNETTFTIYNLNLNDAYSFRIAAYMLYNGKKVFGNKSEPLLAWWWGGGV